MVDVDQFKAFNDHYGHPAGDECLRVVAHALRGSLREATDAVCRYGGEEFALLFPSATAEEARKAADRARAAVEGMAHPHARSPRGVVTVSIGVASMSDGDGPTELTARADAGLYMAKRNGRNRVGTARHVKGSGRGSTR
jgi:diguanylate cyclase (GGDEF)-like protein